ncbi:MAG: NUDIX hydrolase [Pseudomonadota bacterium]
MIPRIGERVLVEQRYTRRPGVYAIVLSGSSVLLTHQMSPEPEFQLPGGGVDPGEQPIAALHREVFEETGWSVRLLRHAGMFRRFTYMPEYDLWAEKLCGIYLCRAVQRRGPPAEAGHSAHLMPLPLAVEAVGNAGDALLLRRAARRFPQLFGAGGRL